MPTNWLEFIRERFSSSSSARGAPDKNTRSFIEFCRNEWTTIDIQEGTKVVLIEANRMSPNHVAERCFIEALANGKPIKVYAYDISESGSFRDANTLAYYKGTGIEVIKPKLTAEQGGRCHEMVKRFSSLISNQEIFDITIDGVWVGDLITDTELVKQKIPTVVNNLIILNSGSDSPSLHNMN